MRTLTLLVVGVLPSVLAFYLPPPPPPSRSVVTSQAQLPTGKGAPLGSWRKAFQQMENGKQQSLSVQLPKASGPVDGLSRFGRNLAHLASRLTPERWTPRSWGDSRIVQSARSRARVVGGMALAASDRVADGFLDRIGHPVMSGLLEPLVFEPMEIFNRVLKRWWRRAKRAMVVVTASFMVAFSGSGVVQAAVRGRVKDTRNAATVKSTKKARTKVQLVVKEEGPVQKIKGIVVKNPEKVAGGAVAVGGGLYLYKKKKDEDEAWAHLDDDWYYQEDELPKARYLATRGQLGDVTLADIDKAVSEGKVAQKGKKKDPKARRVVRSDQVIVKEYKKPEEKEGMTSQVLNFFRKTKTVTRLVNEEQLAWSSLDEEKKEAAFMMAVSKEMNRLAPVKLTLPFTDAAEEEQVAAAAAAAAAAVAAAVEPPEAAAPVVPEGASVLEMAAAQANVTASAAAVETAPVAESSKPSPLDLAYSRLEPVLTKSGITPEEAAEAFANVVNVVVVKVVDDLVPTLKGSEADTINRVEALLSFMEQAGDLFMKVAPNVTSITPVTYQGQAPARKLEMIYSRYCQQALLEDLEYGNAKAVRIQELFDISNKKADKIAQQILRSQENWMKLLEKQLGPLEQLAGNLGEGGDLSKMLESMGGPLPDMGGGAGGEKELKETMEALKAVVQQGGLSDADIEELRRVCSSQGVDLDELVRTMDAVSESMPPENQELARMFKEALRRNS